MSGVGRAGRPCPGAPSLPGYSGGVGEGGALAAVYLRGVWKLAAA